MAIDSGVRVVIADFQPGSGTRVEIRGNPSGISLKSRTGTIVRPDPDLEGFFIVRLDEPAVTDDEGVPSILPEIREAADNLEPIPDDC